MPASHRKFGDLLEEGIKRVNLTRKKPIGYILDEFGYELRPDDLTKGRHALGHWYYKKRIPASFEDVSKLAQLIVTNSDVDRDWLKLFLESAGYPEPDKLCNQFFLPAAAEPPAPQPISNEQPINSIPTTVEKIPAQPRRSWLPLTLSAVILFGIVAIIILKQVQAASSIIPATATENQPLQSSSPISTSASPTSTAQVEVQSTLPPITVTPDFATFDGQCPIVSSTSAFEYTSPQSFRDFMNTGGSLTALQSGFNAQVQKKDRLRDGHIAIEDLTGDGQAEVIISAILETGSLWQILGCDTGQYQPLVNITDPDKLYLRFVVDLNGNKLPEIVGYRQVQKDNTQWFEFFVREWNGHQIVDRMDSTRFDEIGSRLPDDITDWQRMIPNATATTRDTNGDGLYELVITGGLITPVPTCETRFERQFTEIWAWNGKSYQMAERVYIPPIYRFQRAADGDLAFALQQYDSALKAYQDVLFDANLFAHNQYLPQFEYCKGISSTSDTTLADEQDLLAAYARWRILLINTIQNSPDAMQVVYQTLQEKFPIDKPGHSYAAIASAFRDEYQASQNLNAACDAANKVAKEQTLYPGHIAENVCFIP